MSLSLQTFISRGIRALIIAVCMLFASQSSASFGAVAVISNRTNNDVTLTVFGSGAEIDRMKSSDRRLPPGELTVINLRRGETAKISANGSRYELQPDTAYYFAKLPSGKIDLGQIGVGEVPAMAPGGEPLNTRTPQKPGDSDDTAHTITVKILVDEEETSKPAIWQRRLKDRVAAVSDIIERYCGMRLKVIATGTWESDNRIKDFDKAVSEFIEKVDPGEARIAIGFTSQYEIVKGRTHLGGTRGPLAHHILLREWSQLVSEPERMELLLHEVGHFMGAVHSPESDSVMRVILGDKQARARKFQVRFDPLNTLAINLVAEEWRIRPLNGFGDLSPATKARLRAIYQTIEQALPEDPAAAHYLFILDHSRGAAPMIGTP